jgi:hypothetical protein
VMYLDLPLVMICFSSTGESRGSSSSSTPAIEGGVIYYSIERVRGEYMHSIE